LLAIAFDFVEIFVNWRSGHTEVALPLAIEFAENCVIEQFLFG
jgi:hypothetical protein